MSLTSILKGKQNKILRSKLSEEFPKPLLKLSANILALPRTKNYQIVGTAFDYLLRFYIENKYPNSKSGRWVADAAIFQLNQLSKRRIGNVNYQGKSITMIDFQLEISNHLEEVHSEYELFLESGLFTDALLMHSIFLAQLDLIFRVKYFDPNFGIYDPADIEDLSQLIEIIDFKNFVTSGDVYCNPVFGKGSLIVGGADADLIIGDLLIDVKTTKHLKLDRIYFDQLLCYYILSLIGGVNLESNINPIKNIGVYF